MEEAVFPKKEEVSDDPFNKEKKEKNKKKKKKEKKTRGTENPVRNHQKTISRTRGKPVPEANAARWRVIDDREKLQRAKDRADELMREYEEQQRRIQRIEKRVNGSRSPRSASRTPEPEESQKVEPQQEVSEEESVDRESFRAPNASFSAGSQGNIASPARPGLERSGTEPSQYGQAQMRKNAVHSSNSERSRPVPAQYSESSSGVASSRRRQSETGSNGPSSVYQSSERAGSQSRLKSKRRSSSIASQLNEGRSSAHSPPSSEGRSSMASQQQEVAKPGSEGRPKRPQKDRADSGPKKRVPPSPLRNVLSSNDVEPRIQSEKPASSDKRTPSASGRGSETSQAQKTCNPGRRSRAGTGKTKAGLSRTSTLRPALSPLTEEKVKKVEETPKVAEEEDSDEELSSAFVRNEEAERERQDSTIKTMMNRRIGVMERQVFAH
ncbi:uncharacterized protein L3040_005752 [Drepanopeziza brunnea f. sp. 'multigermtubi']|uniref:uncharacterized protein n=1 Tax=Drepanopeziza brunnea f. sp. 'multigermtubi' TaxID=698441 RepID=UPI00239253D8|nr:hypothetical protein L3040_005752 [Drepanopeziza brunnea f. sp. 'multigermtubi']